MSEKKIKLGIPLAAKRPDTTTNHSIRKKDGLVGKEEKPPSLPRNNHQRADHLQEIRKDDDL